MNANNAPIDSANSSLGFVLSDNSLLADRSACGLDQPIRLELLKTAARYGLPKSIIEQAEPSKDSVVVVGQNSIYSVLIYKDNTFSPKIKKIGEANQYILYIDSSTNAIKLHPIASHSKVINVVAKLF